MRRMLVFDLDGGMGLLVYIYMKGIKKRERIGWFGLESNIRKEVY